MAEKSLFFNALPNSNFTTGFDRNYNADDISDWLSVFISTGVVKSTTGLQIVADTGMNIKVNAGKAVINGKPYKNDNYLTFTVPTAPTIATPRIDAIVLRFDKTIQNREIAVKYVQGNSDGTIPALQRSNAVYELMLGYITVNQSATTILQSNITDLRGDSDTEITLVGGSTDFGYCPFTTATKGYEDYYDAIVERYTDTTNVTSQTLVVATGLSSELYKPATDLASIYLNGELVDRNDYELSVEGGFVAITFDYNILAGQKVKIVVDRFYDGEGLDNVLDDYLELKQQVEAMSNDADDIYVCNGTNDNVLISQIANDFLSGGTDRSTRTIKVVGTFGMTAPNSGDGGQVSPYNIFNLGLNTTTNRRITFDFSNCSQIAPALENNKYYTMFAGVNVSIIGGSFSLGAGSGYVNMFSSTTGDIRAERSRFIIIGSSNSYIARTGTFIDCYSDVTNLGGTSYAYWIVPTGMLRLVRGEHYCYGITGQLNGVVYLPSGIPTAYIDGSNFPQVARGGFVQGVYLYQATSGGFATVSGAITTLSNTAVGGVVVITGKIPMNKPNLG